MNQEINKIALIGGRGRMGRLFKNLFQKAGLEVHTFDQPLEKERMRRILPECGAVFMCTPVHALPDALVNVTPLLGDNNILTDISSVKIKPMQQMREHFSGSIIGLHPLFGPEPDSRTPLRCAVCPDNSAMEEDTQKIEGLFFKAGITPFRTDAHEHDKAMAYIQGLNFVTSLCYFASLPGDLDLDKFATPSFKRRMDSAHKMLTEDSELFSALFEANPYSAESVRRFKSFMNLAAAGELNLLSDKAAWWWWSKHILSGEKP